MKDKLYVTDKEGNIVDTIESDDKYVKLSEGDRVVRKGVLSYLNDTVEVKYHYIKVNPFSFGIVSKKYTLFNTLIQYIGYMDNKLQYRNGKPIKTKDLSKLSGFSMTTVKKQMKLMKDDDVIRKQKDGKYTYIVVNPFICYIGNRIYLSLYEEFKLSTWRMYCEELDK